MDFDKLLSLLKNLDTCYSVVERNVKAIEKKQTVEQLLITAKATRNNMKFFIETMDSISEIIDGNRFIKIDLFKDEKNNVDRCNNNHFKIVVERE